MTAAPFRTYARSIAAPARRRRGRRVGTGPLAWARSYFAADVRRAVLSTLGLLWLLDGALQFQSFMYSGGFAKLLTQGAIGEPQWLASSIGWSVHIFQQSPAAWNTSFALIQIAIGIGLLYRPTVKPALAVSFAWALVVWWVGEDFGFLLMQMTSASPMTGAPGAVVLYALVGAAVWPNRRPGGLLGVRGTRTAWAVLWLLMAWLWLQFQNSSTGVISARMRLEAPSGMGWLTAVQHWAAGVTSGDGVWLALLLAALSAAIGVAVAANWRPRPFLAAAVVLNILYWVLGQGFGGIFTGQGTDPNAAPLFVLLAVVLWALVPEGGQAPAGSRRWAAGGEGRGESVTPAAAAAGEARGEGPAGDAPGDAVAAGAVATRG